MLPPLYTPSRAFTRVCLELSLKPFTDTSPATRDRVLNQLFRQWMPLLQRAQTTSVMLWIGDGLEILDFRGDLDDQFEWGYWLGSANKWEESQTLSFADKTDDSDSDEQGIGFGAASRDAHAQGLHQRPRRYTETPARFDYRWLQDLITDIKRIGALLTGTNIEVGLTFDPGPEFAINSFKYERHPEICTAGDVYSNTFVPCMARLNADAQNYAGFPNGIPVDTGIGTFLGRQLECLERELDFDFVWFSNGFGFGGETWSLRGALFDGEQFRPEKAHCQRQQILRFWREFRDETALPVRTRGTNMTSGVDLSSDGVPLAAIYDQVENLEVPVNSPWAALDKDFGLELCGWMSHVARLPRGRAGSDYATRFYAHDPWWMNSPYLDRYERRAHDIFLPALVARLGENGAIAPADYLSILSADNSHGQLPDAVAAEVSAHLIRARELAPDALAPLLWVYPLAEYETAVFEDQNPRAVFPDDWFIRGAINAGLPLNTVADSQIFLAQPLETFAQTLIITPVPAPDSPLRAALLQHAKNGGHVVFYGALEADDNELLDVLGLENAAALDGDFELQLAPEIRQAFAEENIANKIHHCAVFSNGGLRQKARESLACATRDGQTRALAARAKIGKGELIWLRGGVSIDTNKRSRLLPAPLDATRYFPTEMLLRAVCESSGVALRFARADAATRAPLSTIARSRNAWALAIFNPARLEATWSLPPGAPVPLGQTVEVAGKFARWTPDVAALLETRVFVEQNETSTVSLSEVPSVMANVRRRWLVKGLKNATLRFFPEADAGEITFLSDPVFPYFEGEFPNARRAGDYLELENLSGDLLISW